MGGIGNINNSNEVEVVRTENDLIELTEEMLLHARATINSKKKWVPVPGKPPVRLGNVV